jgi:hypothetical protein
MRTSIWIMAFALTLGLAAPAARAADLSGLWIVTANIGAAPQTIDCAMLQVGDQLEGWCEPEGSSATPTPFTGQISKGTASWAYDATNQGQRAHMSYAANNTTSDAAMSGTLTLSGQSSIFTAVRK